METIDQIDEMEKRLMTTNDVEAIFYLGALDMLRDLWLDGGDAADVAAEKFHQMCNDWLNEWIDERTETMEEN